MSKTLVIGGTGMLGSAVVDELRRRKADVRLLVREKKASLPSGVDVAVGDLLDPPAVERAMAGCDQLYLLNAVTPDELTQGLIAYDVAKRRKLRHVVYHSVFRVEEFHDYRTSHPSSRSRARCARSTCRGRSFARTTFSRTIRRCASR